MLTLELGFRIAHSVDWRQTDRMTLVPRRSTAVDEHVGERMRARRRELGMSQQHLAQPLRMTFQQVQKYERGANRVSASRLYEAAVVLGVTPAYFFEGLAQPANDPAADGLETSIKGFLASEEGRELAATFPSVRPSLRRPLLDLVRAMTDEKGVSEQ